MKLQFFLRFHTTVGQTLQIAGNFKSPGTGEGEAIPMSWLNENYWQASVEIDPSHDPEIRYQYQLVAADGKIVTEWGNDRCFTLKQGSFEACQFVDTWNHAGEYENAFYTAPFLETLLPQTGGKKPKQPKTCSHIFRVKAPLLQKNEVICLLGSVPALGEWATEVPTMLHREGNWWTVSLDLPKEGFPLQYKYGVYNTKEKAFVRFEAGANRSLFGDAGQHLTVVHDGFVQLPNNTWKGAGVAIPVFSLRSKNSFGVGEFTDLPLLVDWANQVNMKLIQLLPVNDTTATHSWMDSYPYAAISAFALHPIFINLEEVAGKKQSAIVKPLKNKQKELNDLPAVDYEEVMKIKMAVLKELFVAQKDVWLSNPEYQEFFDRNQYWLVPYAAFCYLRDQNLTADFTQWKEHSHYEAAAIDDFVSPEKDHHDDILLHYYIQYQLHRQLKAATAYAHRHGIIVKGDIPIGIYRYSCDAWMSPALYNMDQQAGAPPDDFAIKGQNWGFPTYNWQKMEEDGYTWWKQRFAQMSEYFDAFRIDHILGFFRIWSIPLSAVEGIMGHFVPSIPVHVNEFSERQIWFNHHRYTRPYITENILRDRFGNLQQYVRDTFLEETGFGQFNFREEFDTQRKVENWFAHQEIPDNQGWLKQGLLDLHSNVILFEEKDSNGTKFHFRFAMEQTSSFRMLEWDTRQKLKDLYVNYFYQRQDDFWMQEAMHKLPALKASTNMLICGEDLGMVPHCVPDVMKQLGILSLEIQRMPKDPKKEFFHPNDAPYLSVVTPSTHDMSTIRGWWEEDHAKTQRFFNQELGQWGEAPLFCEAWINRSIIIQHLNSPAMWSVFQLQDLLGMDAGLRRNDPGEERINIPAVAKHYWRYRMHMTLESLMKEKAFNTDLKEYIKAGGRA
ncbi:4-alpha-glucanotransferase [Flavihumibacter stibioxidans]|uniref:4-alpha-glucanotransferase n=1 Tax=Flavihumibacter stibioxidans TaxID=1834163 RepID=A0ABR7M3F5_9BACT|nr:4-alpha-glucanotransferase [Flavihumibacter stibioxidans]MBC6489476.1 4-alpha-glucanotransferase [Flavihumibacter stibioxidans]